jgi:hypothetical protein
MSPKFGACADSRFQRSGLYGVPVKKTDTAGSDHYKPTDMAYKAPHLNPTIIIVISSLSIDVISVNTESFMRRGLGFSLSGYCGHNTRVLKPSTRTDLPPPQSVVAASALTAYVVLLITGTRSSNPARPLLSMAGKVADGLARHDGTQPCVHTSVGAVALGR